MEKTLNLQSQLLKMQIKSIKYEHFPGEMRHWVLNPLDFEKINLLVGKNASGKTQTLAIIYSLSNLLCENNTLNFQDGCYDITFVNNEKTYEYILEFHDGIVTKEILELNGIEMIKRTADGKGSIKSDKGVDHFFEIPQKELKANRRDKINYPYLEDINLWATHVRMFQFGNDLAKGLPAFRDPTKKSSEFVLKNTDLGAIITFHTGQTEFPDTFVNNIIKDFNSIGYNIEGIEIGAPTMSNFQQISNLNLETVCFLVKEKGIDCKTDQGLMSSGMFRALSHIIHFNYYELKQIPGVVLIDDIGEGLDFERSTKLIELLVSKVEKSTNMQLIMSTNDSFVMNSVDLKYWQIIDRNGNQVNYYNHKNTPKSFDEYKFTGLNNFDFFTTGFFKTGFDEQE